MSKQVVKVVVCDHRNIYKDLFKYEGKDIIVSVEFPDGRECQLFLHADKESWLHTVGHGEYKVWTPKEEV